MGLFDFIADAGEKIFGGEAEAAEVKEMSNGEKAVKLKKAVDKLGLKCENFMVEVEGNKATVHGKVGSQAEKEKIILALGNTAGIAMVADHIEVESPEAEAAFYTVKKGDYLSAIAKDQYGDANKYMAIFEANKPMLTDPDLIYPGQVLRIPPLKKG